MKKGVLWSWDEPLIEPGELTVGGLLQAHGYATACIGKWHLGLGWQFHDPEIDSVDFSKPVTGGPTTLGFDSFFGITASLDIPPKTGPLWCQPGTPKIIQKWAGGERD